MSVYPRPDFEHRDINWKSLNGEWDFMYDDYDAGLQNNWKDGLPTTPTVTGDPNTPHDTSAHDSITKKLLSFGKVRKSHKPTEPAVAQKRKIQVPFVFQCPASGLNERGVHEVLWYERQVTDIRTDDEKSQGYRLLIRFGAVDYQTTVWVDGNEVGQHRGGHVPFEFDVTDVMKAESRLSVRVFDSAHDLTQPRGKQYWEAQPESIFYTPSSGIWQSVWTEAVPPTRVGDSSCGTVLRSNDIENGQLHARIAIIGGQAKHVEVETKIGGIKVDIAIKEIAGQQFVDVDVNMRVASVPKRLTEFEWYNGVGLWSPEAPLLYDVSIRLYDDRGMIDEVQTTTGMRSLEWTRGDGTFRLNGRPLFQALVLDQGYWPSTFMTPPSPDALKADIELAKSFGFNGCRKHQKVEDPIFLYWADRLGFLVWGEMASAHAFSDQYCERFNQEWVESVRRDINHPCIVTWTPGNESWGYPDLKNNIDQRNHLRHIYKITKELDTTRSVNDNCGWEHVSTDLITFHDYADADPLSKECASIDAILAPKGIHPMFVDAIPGDQGVQAKMGAPVLCTEFGGVNIKTGGGGGGGKDWGYTTASNPEDLMARLERLVMAIVDGGLICGFVYTQLTDIEQETNGLCAYNRQLKLDPNRVRTVMERAKEVYNSKVT